MNKRIFELDILRGLTIALMIIVDSPPDIIYETLRHAVWEGIHMADTVFPSFVFVMGTSAAISASKRTPSMTKIFRRTAILFGIGILLNLFIQIRIDAEHLRFFGILQRLALSYFFGMLILLKLKDTAKILLAAFLLLIISSLGFHIYAPTAPFDVASNISHTIDYIFPGADNMLTPKQEPEGLYGTMASTASMLFGIVAGKLLIQNERQKLILYGAGLLVCGYFWSYFDLVIKQLWTAPFALLNAGGDVLLLAAFGILFEYLPRTKKYFCLFDSLGKNPIFFFVVLNMTLIFAFTEKVGEIPLWSWLYQNTFQGLINVELSTTLFCVAWCLILMIFAEFLNRRNIFIKF